MDTTKDAIKQYLDEVAKAIGKEWHTQLVHKGAVAAFWLDMFDVKDQAVRDAALKQWQATPSGFGCNSSGLAQLIDETRKASKTSKVFAGF